MTATDLQPTAAASDAESRRSSSARLIVAALGLTALSFAVRAPVLGKPVVDLAATVPWVGWVTVGLHFRAQPRRRNLGTGMVLAGLFWTSTWLGLWHFPPAGIITVLANASFWFAACWGVLHFPNDLTTTQREHQFFGLFVVFFLTAQIAICVVSLPEWNGFPASVWWPHLIASRQVFNVTNQIAVAVDILSAAGFGAVVIKRLARMQQFDRQIAYPFISGFLATAAAGAALQTGVFYLSPTSETILGFVALSVPVMLIGADTSARRLHSSVVENIDRRLTGELLSAAQIETILRNVLHAEDLQLLVWNRRQQHFASPSGIPTQLPDPAENFVQVIKGAEGPVAAVVTEPAFRDHARIVNTALRASSMALKNAQLHSELLEKIDEINNSRHRIAEAQIEERNRIGRDLHDGVQQRLLSASLRLGRIVAADDSAELDRHAEALRNDISASLSDLRSLAHGLSPEELRQFGLHAALVEVAQNAPITVKLAVPNERYSAVVEATAYYFVCEAINNAVKHGGGTVITVTATVIDAALSINALSDGVVEKRATAGNGLLGLKDRVESVGGAFTYRLEPGQPALLTATLPLKS